jgi:hypothetical protein
MKISRRDAISFLAAAAGVAVVACGGDPGLRAANLTAGNMPDGESWTGVYFHPVYGYLHLQESDSNVIGKWKRADQSAWGELSGVKTGNLLHYKWKEHKYGLVGPSSVSEGKGYFVYTVGKENIAELNGQFGVGDDEVGADWHCVKQVRTTPNLNSITGDNPNGTNGTAKENWQ